jgi:hypothetical protein
MNHFLIEKFIKVTPHKEAQAQKISKGNFASQ